MFVCLGSVVYGSYLKRETDKDDEISETCCELFCPIDQNLYKNLLKYFFVHWAYSLSRVRKFPPKFVYTVLFKLLLYQLLLDIFYIEGPKH